jgi:hypothetical protein
MDRRDETGRKTRLLPKYGSFPELSGWFNFCYSHPPSAVIKHSPLATESGCVEGLDPAPRCCSSIRVCVTPVRRKEKNPPQQKREGVRATKGAAHHEFSIAKSPAWSSPEIPDRLLM